MKEALAVGLKNLEIK
jgi:hypothetical protein